MSKRLKIDRPLTYFIVMVSVTFAAQLRAADRSSLSLDGTWEIEDSKQPEAVPTAWSHRSPVPGLAHSAQPPFPQVDEFDSRQLLLNRARDGKVPPSAVVYNAGVSRQERNWFWYRRRFEVPTLRKVAILRINKAQFGAAVWLNGVKIGDHLPCFSAAIFDVSQAIRQGRNELIVRDRHMKALFQLQEQGKRLHTGHARVIKVLIRLYEIYASDIADGVENSLQAIEMV